MSRERRIHPRSVTHIRATLRCGEGTIEGVTENLGAGGMFFSTGDLETTVEMGDSVVVALQVAEGRIVECAGDVLRTERYFDGADVRRSFAVKFDLLIDVASLVVGD